MGCSSSVPKEMRAQAAAEKPIWKREESSVQEIVKKKRKNSVTRMSHTTVDAVRDMFSEYRRNSSTEPDNDSSEPMSPETRRGRGVMKRDGLRKMLTGVDEELFEFLWRIFDVDGVGTVDADNFVMAMGLLTEQVDTVDDQIEAIFFMFDLDHDSQLTPDEFEQMIRATVSLSLGRLLDTETGMQEFEAQLQKEYSEENLEFWRAAKAYAELDDGAARLKEAQRMHEEFILEGSMRQVNLPSTIASKATAGVEEASASGEAPPLDLFEQASAEVFKLMERDTYSRFKRDDESIKKLVASFHREAGLGEGESNVTFEKFSTWAKANPSVLICFTGLTKAIRRVLDQRKQSSKAGSGGV